MSVSIERAGEEILAVAAHFVHLYEVQNNAVWDDPDTIGEDPRAQELRELMEETGWQPGWAYCAAFCEVVWKTAYTRLGAPPAPLKEFTRIFTPSVMESFRNVGPSHITREPVPGAIFFMQLGRTGRGHAGIVAMVGEERISTIEGNTSPDAKAVSAGVDREGNGIFRRTRTLDFTPKPGSLWLRGFLNPVGF